jgi:hypothetical protein
MNSITNKIINDFSYWWYVILANGIIKEMILVISFISRVFIVYKTISNYIIDMIEISNNKFFNDELSSMILSISVFVTESMINP